MKRILYNFFGKKENILILCFNLIFSIILSTFIKFGYVNIQKLLECDICLTVLLFCFVFFVSLHFIYDRRKIYDVLYKYRYVVGVFLFIILVLGKFHGTSIGCWDDQIQPSYNFSYNSFIGSPRNIRSDEWLVNTPIMFAQFYDDFKINNSLIRAVPTNVFLLSTAPVLDILILSRPLSAGFLFLGMDYGLSIWWYGRLFLLFFTTFELLMILTKKNKKTSLFGAIIVCGSSVIQWFFAAYIVEIIIGGQLALILFDKLFNVKRKYIKILCSLFIAIGFLNFCLTLYPAHQIPFGYIFLIIAIYLLLKNKNLPNFKKDLRYLIISISIILIILVRFYILSKNGIDIIGSTVYPGKRFVNGGYFSEWQRLLQTPYTLLLPFKSSSDACTISSFLCLFPLPILLGILYIFKRRRYLKIKNIFQSENFLLIFLILLSLVYFSFCLFSLPDFFVKYTMLSKTTVNAICAPIGYICIFLMCILFDKISFNKKINKLLCFLISILLSFINIYLSNKFMPDFVNIYINLFLGAFFTFIYYLYLTNDTKYKKNIFMFIMFVISIVNIGYVNPFYKGIDVIYKKPIVSEINKIVNEDPNARWITLNSFISPNYFMMNGAKTINSTNIYPNLKIWKKVDSNGNYEDIYNRYAHIVINLTDDKTSFDLIQVDLFVLNLNYNDILKLDIQYIYSTGEIEYLNHDKFILEKIYDLDNSYIYKVVKK